MPKLLELNNTPSHYLVAFGLHITSFISKQQLLYLLTCLCIFKSLITGELDISWNM